MRSGWVVACGIWVEARLLAQEQARLICLDGVWTPQGGHTYVTDSLLVAFGNWHTLHLEASADSAESITAFFDDVRVGPLD